MISSINFSFVFMTFSKNSSSFYVALSEFFHFSKSCVNRQRYFHERKKEFDQIIVSFFSNDANTNIDTSLRFFVIFDFEDVEKTKLTHKYIVDYHANHDVVLFIKTNETNRLSQQFEKLIFKFDLMREADKSNLEKCKEILKAWFKISHEFWLNDKFDQFIFTNSAPSQLKWLLIFDNVKRWATLDFFWSYESRESVLIINRNFDILSQLIEIASTLELHNLLMKKAKNVLKYYASFDENDIIETQKTTRKIANRLKNLFFVVMQIDSNIKECHSSIAEFNRIHSKQNHLYDLFLNKNFFHEQNYDHNLTSIWTLKSFFRESEMSQKTFVMLYIIVFMNFECISKEFLWSNFERNRLFNYFRIEFDFFQKRKIFLNVSFVKRSFNESNIKIHRMIQQIVRAKISKDSLFVKNVFKNVLAKISMHWFYFNRIYVIDTQEKVNRWSKCVELLSHVLSVSREYFEFKNINNLFQSSLDFAELLFEVFKLTNKFYHS